MANFEAPLDGPRSGPRDGGVASSLVVLCHGLGADGHDLIDLGAQWAAAVPGAVFVAPNAPERYAMAPIGRQWFDVGDHTPEHMATGVRKAAHALNTFIDAELARLALPRDHYAMMGFSQGAMMVLFAGLRRNPGPRAILAYSGALIAPEKLAAEKRNTAPVLLVHGEADPVVPVARSHDAEDALRAAGGAVEAVFRPGLGHAIDEVGLSTGALFLQRAFATG